MSYRWLPTVSTAGTTLNSPTGCATSVRGRAHLTPGLRPSEDLRRRGPADLGCRRAMSTSRLECAVLTSPFMTLSVLPFTPPPRQPRVRQPSLPHLQASGRTNGKTSAVTCTRPSRAGPAPVWSWSRPEQPGPEGAASFTAGRTAVSVTSDLLTPALRGYPAPVTQATMS